MEGLFKSGTDWLASGVETAAGIVIAIAALQTFIRALARFLHPRVPPEEHPTSEEIRLQLGRWLALSLEFELAADILRTAVAPSWNEIAQLAAIIVIRTVLNFFLQREIDQAKARENLPKSSPVDRGPVGRQAA